MHASVRPALSVNIPPIATSPAARETSAALSMRMTISKVNFFYGRKQTLFDVSMGIATVIVPAAYRGILTAILLAFARVAGETAPLLFTALGNQFWSPGWTHPTASLPVMIFTYALAPYDDWHRQAWAAGLVLLVLILVINIVARAILSRGIAVPRS